MRVIALKRENVIFRFERRAPVDMTMVLVLSMGRRQCRKMTGESAEVGQGLNRRRRRKWIRSGSEIQNPMCTIMKMETASGDSRKSLCKVFGKKVVCSRPWTRRC
jgi:hypothetical protein